MPSQHTALILPAAGAAFEVAKRDTPTPGPGQVLVRNKAVALNPIDNFIQKTGLFTDGFPAVVGGDGAGEVAALGAGVKGWSVGDKVFYQSAFVADRGTFQEFTIADAARIAKVPSKLSYEEIVSVPLTFATAAIGAYKAKSSIVTAFGHSVGGAGLVAPWEAGGRGKYSGQVAVILGGSSSVGQFVIQLAKLSGFIPYAKLPDAVRQIVGDAPLKYVYDAISNADSNKAGWDLLSPGGVMVVVLPPSPEVGVAGKDDERGRRLVFVFGIINHPDNHEFGAGLYAAVSEMFEKGELKPNKVETVGNDLRAIPHGLEKLAKGVSGVKLVATI
ncbi:GroES-like protein [Peniophora sp. CONT]|nr:GroES-like protein [Peniophora sp. CONT]